MVFPSNLYDVLVPFRIALFSGQNFLAISAGSHQITHVGKLTDAHCKQLAKKDSQWIGLRENLQETIDFPIKYGAFL
jgi:hypothetical protein